MNSKTLQRVRRSTSTHWVGNGFPVRSVFSYSDSGRELSPFLLLDHAAPHHFDPGQGKRGVGAHPHKGFETVTIVYQGELEHRDSSGGGGRIGPSDVQWMTAGSGIIHEEFHSADFVRTGGTLEMVQLWVNLPARHKSADPGYQTLRSADIPTVPLGGDAGTLRVISGEYHGTAGPARTFTPVHLYDVRLSAGSAATLALPEAHHSTFLVLRGAVTFGDRQITEGELAILSGQGTEVALTAGPDTILLVLSGEPIDEPIYGHGPFVMNTASEIEQAFDDYRRGRMGTLEFLARS